MDVAEDKPDANESRQPTPPASAAFDQLRELLLGAETSKLNQLEARIENPALRAEDVGRILPQAFGRCSGQEDLLAMAMAPSVEAALKTSVKRDPGVLANAIFPIIGPAIRKSIGDTFSRLIQTFSHALENSLSVRGMGWRLEAWRTGRPFAEVVLYHTLVFRSEQVLLVHRPSGLLIQAVAAPEVHAADEDVISGMLSAIQDFMADSFNTVPGEHLQTVRMGELNLWVETGPHAILAAVIRGQAPSEFQTTLARALEFIHKEESVALAAYTGDARPFESLRPILEGCLQSQTHATRRSGLSPQAAVIFAIFFLALLAWAAHGWRQHGKREALFSQLRAEPGLVITGSGREGGRLVILGLRDPLASDPVRMANEAGWTTNQVEFRLQPFLALNPEITLQRATMRLDPPPGVDMSFRDGILSFSGAAPAAWWRVARPQALLVPGVESVQSSALQVSAPAREPGTSERLASIRQACDQMSIRFDRGKFSTLEADSELASAADSARRLRELAQSTGAKAALIITAHSDASGGEQFNAKLRRQRADWVYQKLVAAGVPEAALQIDSGGTASPTVPESDTVRTANSRRVTFSVFWQPLH